MLLTLVLLLPGWVAPRQANPPQSKTVVYHVSPTDALVLLIVPNPFPTWNVASQPRMGAFEIYVDASGKTTLVRPFPLPGSGDLGSLETLARELLFQPLILKGVPVPFASILAFCTDEELGTVPCAPKLNGQGGVTDPIPQRVRSPGCEDPKTWSNCKLANFPKSSKISGKTPWYPENAKAARVMGNVVVRVDVSDEGHVTSTRILGGPPMLYKSATDSLKTWTYRPLTWNGVPIEAEFNAVIRYRLAG